MHIRTKTKYGEITKCVLNLIGTGLLFGAAGGLSCNPTKTTQIIKGYAAYSRQQVRRTIARLRLLGYVYYDNNDTKAPLRLTRKGLKRAKSYGLIERFGRAKSKKWDYLWRVVTFDIPESKKLLRDAFRYDLLSLGFMELQESVYVTPYACSDEIKELAKNRFVEKYVLVTVMPNLGQWEGLARKRFTDREG